MAASSLDPDVAFGPQQEWESPRQERPWLGLSLEALELWGMPEEAWPGYGIPWDNLWNYTLKKKDHPNIHVHLARQVFTTKPAHEKHTYFSFWMSEEFEVGPVANPYGIGTCVNMSKGYNHCNATLAFGEIKLLAGWADEPFLLQWHSQFNLHKLPGQQFPPVLHEWVLLHPYTLQDVYQCKLLQIMADQLPNGHGHQSPAQPNQLPDVEELMHQDGPSLLDVDQVYLEYENGGGTIINVDEIGPDAKKKMVEGMEVIELCDDGIHRVVWQVPRTVDGDWQCL
jgi:hypothetical protein